jgi:flavin reductase (DIM6/NTAB) family NADH-FMN oxidoreductase RutF
MPVTKQEFRHALGKFASAVTVVTTRDAEGNDLGITVTAFSSLSLDPPLILICIDHHAAIHDSFTLGRAFVVNILSAQQDEISQQFASRVADRFAGVDVHEGALGVLSIDGACANVECRVTNLLPGGDHTIVVGSVEGTEVSDLDPLLHYRGSYRCLV